MYFTNSLNEKTDKSKLSTNQNQQIPFKGNNDDRSLVEGLAACNGAIIKPKERLLKQAIKNLSQDGSSKNIEFLISTAENLKYGVKQGSSLQNFLKTNSNLGSKVENNDWFGLLVSSAHNALEKNNSDTEKAILNEKLAALLTKTSNTEDNLIILRNKLLKSIKELPADKNDKSLSRNQASIKKHVDFFIASSEIDTSEKIECLKVLLHLTTPEYQINSQLKNKKTQVLAELLNDLVVKTPESPILTIKQTNQKHHGMCAAISLVRKILPHEFKLNYANTILSELDNKPFIEVYDITSPDKTAKVKVQKTSIDYDDALKSGYRIVDASATNWMNIADSTGNGEIQARNYTPFDRKNYGMFNDSHWTLDMSEPYKAKQNVLRATIKLKGLIKSIETKKFEIEKTVVYGKKNVKNFLQVNQESRVSVAKTLAALLPLEDKNKISALTQKLLSPKKVENEELKIDACENEFVKKQKLKKIILETASNVNEAKLNESVDKIYLAFDHLAEMKKNTEKDDKVSTPKFRTAQYKNLFKLAGFYRAKTQFELDTPEFLHSTAQKYNVKTKQELISDRLMELTQGLKSDKLDEKLPEIASELKIEPNKALVIEKLEKINLELNKDIPEKAKSIVNRLGFNNPKELMNVFVDSLNETINKADDKANLASTAALIGVEPDKKLVLENLKSISTELKQENLQPERLVEIQRKFGIDNDATLANFALISVNRKIKESMTADEAQKLAENLGVKFEQKSIFQALSSINDEVKTMKLKYDEYSELIGAKTQKEIILNKLEEQKIILSAKTLDSLRTKFDEIDEFEEKQQKYKALGEKISKPEVYKFSESQKEVFKALTNDFSRIKRENTREYKSLNKELEPQLKSLYTNVGQSKGEFWVGEEGQSGLGTRDQTRIYSQMTGEDGHTESNPEKALDHIQSGKSLGILSSHVLSNEFSGHAQCVYDVDYATIVDSETQEKSEERVLSLDNTWGNAEFKHVYKDSGGNDRTDYNRGFGGKEGFLVRKEGVEGITLEELISGVGVVDNKLSGHKYPLFIKTILNGSFVDTEKNTNDIITEMTALPKLKQKIGYLLKNLKNGNAENIAALNKSLTASLTIATLKVVEENKTDSLKLLLEKQITEKISEHEDQMFKSQGKELLTSSVSEKINSSVENILKSDQPKVLMNVAIAKEIEKIVKAEVDSSTTRGKKVNLNQFKVVQMKSERLNTGFLNLINGADTEENSKLKLNKGIAAREDFEKIPQNHSLRSAIRKISMLDYVENSTETYEAVLCAKTPEDFKAADEKILSTQKNKYRSFFNKDKISAYDASSNFKLNALKVIKEIETEESLNLIQAKEIVEKKSTEIAQSDNKGSLKALDEKFKQIKTLILDNYSQSSAFKNEIGTELEIKLENAIKKCMDDAMKANSIENLEKTTQGQRIEGWINQKFKPQSNEEFMQYYKQLHLMDSEKFDKLLDKSSAKELGIVYEDPYKIVQNIKTGHSESVKKLSTIASHIANYESFNSSLLTAKEKEIYEKVKKQPEWLKSLEAQEMSPKEKMERLEQEKQDFYSTDYGTNMLLKELNIKFSYVGLDKVVNKNQALESYGVRSALPALEVVSDDIKNDNIVKNLNILGNIVVSIENLKKQKSKVQYDAQLEGLKKSLNDNTAVFVKSAIRPRHQYQAVTALKEWYKQISIDPQSEKSQKAYFGLTKQFNKDYITDYPSEFLETLTKELPEMELKNGSNAAVNNEIVKIWSNNLLSCINTAHKSEIEFSLMKDISEGKLPQIAKQLKDKDAHILADTKTGESILLNSQKGMAFLFKSMQDSTNKNHTLKYFLKETGLAKDAVNFFTEGPDPQKHVTHIKNYIKQLEKRSVNQAVINNVYSSFAEKLDSTQPINETVKIYFENLDKAFEGNNSSTLQDYKKEISEHMELSNKLNRPENLSLWHKKITEKQDAYTEEVIESALMHMSILGKKYAGISNLEDVLPENSQAKIKAISYKEDIIKANKEIDKLKEQLQGPILDKIEAVRQKEKVQALSAPAKTPDKNELMQIAKDDVNQTMEKFSQAVVSNDQASVQSIVKQIINSDNKVMNDNLADTLFDKSKPILLKTFVAGILAEKRCFEPLIEYAEEFVGKNKNFDNIDEQDQSIILVADGLIKGIQSENEKLKNYSISALTKLFKFACDGNNKTITADQLTQSFMAQLPKGGSAADAMLFGVLNDKTANIGARSVAINILGTSNPLAFFSLFEDLVVNPNKFADKASDKLYLIDVATNSIGTISKAYPELNCSKIKNALNDKTVDEILSQSKAEQQNEDNPETLASIVKRIKIRMTELHQ
jgi:hypothetical protein